MQLFGSRPASLSDSEEEEEEEADNQNDDGNELTSSTLSEPPPNFDNSIAMPEMLEENEIESLSQNCRKQLYENCHWKIKIRKNYK